MSAFTFLPKKIWQGILFIGILLYLFIESSNRGDFHIFMAASSDLFKQQNIYGNLYFDGYHYYYSILFAILIYPLTFLDSHFAVFLWLLLNVFFLYRIFKLLAGLLPLGNLTPQQQNWWWILCILFSMRLVLENFHVAQMTICLLYLTLEGFDLIRRQKELSGAALIALGINIKLLPIVIVPYLLYRGFFKASAYIVLFYIIFTLLPVLIIDAGQFRLLLISWAKLINPLNSDHIMDVAERSFHSLSTLLSILLVEHVPDKFALPIKRNIADVSVHTLYHVILIARLSLVSFTLYFLRSWPFKPAYSNLHRYWELSYILMIIPLIFPHQQHYAFLFMVPAFMYCLYYLVANKNKKSSTFIYISGAVLTLIYLSVNLKLLLGEFNQYYEHFKILTYGALLLVVVMAVFRPEKTPERTN